MLTVAYLNSSHTMNRHKMEFVNYSCKGNRHKYKLFKKASSRISVLVYEVFQDVIAVQIQIISYFILILSIFKAEPGLLTVCLIIR